MLKNRFLSISLFVFFILPYSAISQTTLIISEYSEGSSNNKYIELYNGTGADVDLSNYEVWKIANGGNWTESTLTLSGTISNGDVYVIYNSNSDGAIIASGDLTWGSANWNGDDAVGLAENISGTMTLIDAVGTDGSDPGNGWEVAGSSNATQNNTIVRKPSICEPNPDWSASAGTSTGDSEWIVYATDTWSYIGSHSSSCGGSSITTPSAPTISSIENGDSQVTLNFTAGADGGASITDFEYSIDNGSTFISSGTNSSPYTISGLSNGTSYNIQIRAVNSEGAGTASSSIVGSPYANQITLNAFGTSVTEDFNTLESAGSSSSLPLGFYMSESGGNSNTTYTASTGSSNSGNTYSFGTDSDRALGGIRSGSLNPTLGGKIINGTGVTLNTVVISYTGETWRVATANRLDQLDFQYSTDATSLTDGTWTDFDALDYSNAGQATGNGSLQHTSSLSDTLTNLGTVNGGFFWIRWNDYDASGSEDGMSIDDLSLTPICKAGSITNSHENIIRGNDITWTHTGTDFTCYEYHWGDNLWVTPFLTNETDSWGNGCAGCHGQGILYVRAKATCASEIDYSNTVSTFWADCYAEDITATVDGTSIVSGGDFTINSTVTWTWSTGGSGEGAGHKLGYFWDSDPTDPSTYNWVWNGDDASGGPQSWSDNAGTNFTSTDRPLYLKSRSTGINSCTNYSQTFFITLKKPEITVSSISGSLSACSGTASPSSETFLVSGNYISNSSGINITAPSGFEVSTDDSNFSSSLTLSTTSGTISSTTVYVRMTADASGTPVGDITCTAAQASNKLIAITGSIAEPPSITSPSSSISDATTCGKNTYAITMANSASGTWVTSPVNATLIVTSQGAQNISVNPANGLNTDITLTWTENTGACSGYTDQIVIAFNQPDTTFSNADENTYLWSGLTDTEWSTGANWYKWDGNMWVKQTSEPNSSTAKVEISPTDNLCISANNVTNLTGQIANLNIANDVIINLGTGAISVNGNIANEGVINGGNSTIEFTATQDQTISGSGSTLLNNLTLNKSSGDLIINAPLQLEGTLSMLKGNINNGLNTLTIGSSSASTGSISYASGSVTGKLRRYFAEGSNASNFFPIGTASATRDVTVAFPTTPGTDQYLTASYNTGYPQLSATDLYEGLPLTTSDGQLIQNYDDEGYWEINPTSDNYSSSINSTTYNLTIHMNGLTGVSSASMDRNKVRLIKSAGPGHTSWEALTHVSIGGADTNSDYTITAGGTGFSFFGAGTEDDNALPVELVSFNAYCNNGLVDLTWQTASENYSEDFEIDYSRDGNLWNTIHLEPAAGFSTELLTYAYTHKQAVSGDNYYRLTQNDIDGTSTTYDHMILNSNCNIANDTFCEIYPNPSSNSFNLLIQNSNQEDSGYFNIMDTQGNIVLTKSFKVLNGMNIQTIQHKLSPGIYHLKIYTNSHPIEVKKITIK